MAALEKAVKRHAKQPPKPHDIIDAGTFRRLLRTLDFPVEVRLDPERLKRARLERAELERLERKAAKEEKE